MGFDDFDFDFDLLHHFHALLTRALRT